MECQICGSEGEGKWYTAREMMFGLRDRFRYYECAACGCVQLGDPPADLSRYYPPEYYSFANGGPSRTWLRRTLIRERTRFAISGRGWLGRWLNHQYPYPPGDMAYWLSRAGLSHRSAILDVGCGSGELLGDLSAAGYRRLLGVDPFVREDVDHPLGFQILRRRIQDTDGRFDFIMFHHSLEHIPDQLDTLRAAAARLAPGGHLLVRVPVASSFAWEEYRENWVQLDAPRHFFLHSVESLRLLGERAGLRLLEVRHDSNELQFIGSELYRQDIPLQGSRKRFSRRAVMRSRRRAGELNAAGRGDQAAFLFGLAPSRGA